MSRKNKPSSKRVSKNYKPISEDFCSSVIKSSKKNNLLEDPQNKYILIYNSDKSAHISREYDAGGSVVLGFRVETKDLSYTIDCHKNMFDIVVEMIHFGFSYSQIKSLVNITHKQYETYKPKDFVTMGDFIYILSLVPKSLYRCNDVLHYVKQFPSMIVEHPSVNELSQFMNITKNQAKRCIDMYRSKPYSHLLTEARKRVESLNKNKDAEKSESEIEQDTKTVDTNVEIEVSQSDSPTPTNETDKSEVSEQVEVDEKPTEVDLTVVEDEKLSEPKTVKNNIVVTEGDADVVEVPKPLKTERLKRVKEKINHSVTMEDFQKVLGFIGIDLDFDALSVQLKDSLTNKSFSDYINESNKEGISNLLYPMLYIRKCFNYSRPFNLAEDKILELYYKDIGTRVIEVMQAVIPNYVVRPTYEYVYRIRERGVKTPNPAVGFKALKEDLDLIKVLYPKLNKSLHKYLFWLESFDLYYYVALLGLDNSMPKKVKKVVYLNDLNMQGYIDNALKLKEVVYYDEFWTTERHELFKEEFKNNGLKVLEVIPELTEEGCFEHSKQYKIFQNYTSDEVSAIKSVYMDGGLRTVVKEFPYRTETALRYKIQEEGWEVERNAVLFEREVEARVQERLKVETERIKEKLYTNESEKLKIRLFPVVRQEVVESISALLKGTILQEIKLEMPNLVRKSSLKDLPNVLPQKIVSKLESLLKSELDNLK